MYVAAMLGAKAPRMCVWPVPSFMTSIFSLGREALISYSAVLVSPSLALEEGLQKTEQQPDLGRT